MQGGEVVVVVVLSIAELCLLERLPSAMLWNFVRDFFVNVAPHISPHCLLNPLPRYCRHILGLESFKYYVPKN